MASGDPSTGSTAIDDAWRQLRAPWAAGVAGLLFAALFTGALVLMRTQPGDVDLAQRIASGQNLSLVIGGMYLAPFAGIMFLWFVAVVRDQIGEREDRFFATVFFGSGLLFVALLFAAAAVATTPVAQVDFLEQAPPSVDSVRLMRSLSYTLLFAFGTRGAAVFMLATATIGIKSGVFPRWFAATCYVLGLALLVAVSFADWVILVLPAWVAGVSLFILRRESSRRPARGAAEA